MHEMTKRYPGLFQRGKQWNVRRRVPDELRPIIGKREVTKSLRTSDFSKAKEDYHSVMSNVEQEFNKARRSLSNAQQADLSLIHAERLAREWYHLRYGNIENETYALTLHSEKAFVKEDLDHFQSLFEGDDEDIIQQELQSTADRLLINDGFPHDVSSDEFEEKTLIGIDKSSKGYRYFLKLIWRGHLDGLKKQREIFERYGSNDPFFSFTKATHSSSIPIKNEQRGLSLNDFINKYINAKDYDLEDRNYKDLLATFRIMKEVIGDDTPVINISYDDLENVLTILKRLPPNFRKLKYRKNMTLEEIASDAEKNNEKLYTSTMINKHMARIKALMMWGLGTDDVQKDYFVSGTLFMKRPKNQNAKDDRDPFTMDELNILFSQDEFAKPNFEKPSIYWASLISLFHGLRMEEILQLRFDDIQEQDNIRFFNIHDEGLNSLKTSNGKRKVPIHNFMWELGFEAVLSAARKKENGRLFHDVPKLKRPRYSAIFTQRYSRYLKKIGIKTKKNSFHSFRHNYRDICKDCGLRNDCMDQIGGWSYEKGAKASYGTGISLIVLNSELQKIKYSGLNLNSISPFSELDYRDGITS